MSKRLTKNEIVEKANKLFNNEYDYSLFLDDNFTYDKIIEKVPIICKKHGIFYTSINGHINGGRGCPKCAIDYKAKKLMMPFDKFEKLAFIKHGHKYKYDKNTYTNAHEKTKIICPKHGEFWQIPSKHLQGQGCPKCYEEIMHNIKTTNLTSSEFYEKANLVHDRKYKYINDFKTTKDKITIICPIHGEFRQEAQSHLQGHGCPKCANTISKPESDIYQYVCGLIGEENVISRDREILDGKELDIYIPKLQIAIEYNGLRWHSEEFNKDKNYHLKKLIKCNEKGIKLIQIFEDEWVEREEIVLKKIRHILGFNDGEKVYARKCIVKEINKPIAYEFLEKNHIQGSVDSTVAFGCFYNGALVGVMLFTEESKDHWNLTRFASDNDKRCIGVAGKLFSAFLTAYNPIYVKSFADRRWTLSEARNVYTKLGFELAEELRPDYRYVNAQKREHKFGYRKAILHRKYGVPLEWTEKEMTEHLGFYRIYDCGLLRYEWKKET